MTKEAGVKSRELESGVHMEEADDGNGLVLSMIGSPNAALDLTEHEVAELHHALGLWLAGVMWWIVAPGESVGTDGGSA